jgi:hypothetical protein
MFRVQLSSTHRVFLHPFDPEDVYIYVLVLTIPAKKRLPCVILKRISMSMNKGFQLRDVLTNVFFVTYFLQNPCELVYKCNYSTSVVERPIILTCNR